MILPMTTLAVLAMTMSILLLISRLINGVTNDDAKDVTDNNTTAATDHNVNGATKNIDVEMVAKRWYL